MQIGSEYRFPTLLLVQIIVFYTERSSRKYKSEVNIGFWLSFWFKSLCFMPKGVPESANQKWISVSGVPFGINFFKPNQTEFLKAQITIEYRFQEFLLVWFFLNRTKRSSWKCKSLRFALSDVPSSINTFWLNKLVLLRA